MIKLWRDDDISCFTTIQQFKPIHDLFIKYNKIHTIAVLAKDLWENKEICYYLATTPNLDIQLHGWDHVDYSLDYSQISELETKQKLTTAIEYLEEHISKYRREKGMPELKITKFLPPWNKESEMIKRVCQELGLEFDNRIGGEVANFHYWSVDLNTLENRLKENK